MACKTCTFTAGRKKIKPVSKKTSDCIVEKFFFHDCNEVLTFDIENQKLSKNLNNL